MRFTVLRSKAVSRQICDKQHQPPLVNYMPTTRQNSKYNVSDAGGLFFFSRLLIAQNMVRVIEGKLEITRFRRPNLQSQRDAWVRGKPICQASGFLVSRRAPGQVRQVLHIKPGIYPLTKKSEDPGYKSILIPRASRFS